MNNLTINKNKRIALIAMFVAIMTVCSWISIPLSVPVTLQTFAVFAACGILGGLDGFISIFVYLLIGAIGVPVFSGFTGGFSRLVGPTGGYLIGFVVSPLIVLLFDYIFGRKTITLMISMFIGLAICYAFGTLWFANVYVGEDGSSMSIMSTLSLCVFPFVIPDIIKIILAASVSKRIRQMNILR